VVEGGDVGGRCYEVDFLYVLRMRSSVSDEIKELPRMRFIWS
jgi:hypothetical protein